MLKKSLSIVFIVLMFVSCSIFLIPHDKTFIVKEVISPVSFVLSGEDFVFKDITGVKVRIIRRQSTAAPQKKDRKKA